MPLTFCRRESSCVFYQHLWSVYRRWSAEKGHSVSHPPVQKVLDFLLYLREVKMMSISSMKGHHSVLSSVFRFRFLEISGRFICKGSDLLF